MESWNIEPKCTQLPVDRHSLHSSRRAIGGAPGIQAVGHRPAGGHNDAEILSEEETVNTTHLGHAFPEPQSACDHQIRGVPCAHPQCTHHTEVALENAESNEPVEMSEDPGDSAEKPEEKLVATPTRADAPRNAGRPNTPRDIDCAKLIIAVGAGLIGAAAAPVVATSALGAIGFSSTGVVGGSLASIIHASIGNVAAGSWFATAQSIAAGGSFPAMGSAVAGGVCAVSAYFTTPSLDDE